MGLLRFCRFLILILISVGLCRAFAATDLPRNLEVDEQVRTLQILGFGSAAKVLGNPFPLGGYSGIEVGLSSEFIPVDDLASLGSTTQDKGEFNYQTLTISKGLYHNVDTLVYFTPTIQEERMLNYGMQLRWGFFQADFFPLTLTAMLYGGGANFSNLINVNTMGMDLLASVTMDRVSLYVGTGRVRATGTFIGGPDGITADQKTVTQDIVDDHSVFGLSVKIARIFVAMEVDRYVDSVYSAKLGFRF